MEGRSLVAGRRQSQFRRCLPFLLFVLLILTRGAPASSGHFFVMADRPYSGSEVAQVRVDLQRGAGEGYYEEDTAPADPFGGADVRIYRIADPIAFLEKQKNLHRPAVVPNYRGESALNGLRQVFSAIFQDSRKAWQRLFSPTARVTVTTKHPDLKQAQPGSYRTDVRSEPKFIPLAGYEVVKEFRYPILKAKPVVPATDAKLTGSSSEFLPDRVGDAYIPLGKLKPGMYLTEVSYGDAAAYAVVFISDTVLITKTSSQETFIWSADLLTGIVRAGVKYYLSDGVTRLADGVTDADGMARLTRPSPEKTYIFGLDTQGGVSVSENFYYDSEIYGLKVYMHTDRPLYQPGDLVQVKIICRGFLDALKNLGPSTDTPYSASILDPRGRVLFERTVTIAAGEAGGDFDFILPENSLPGGYTIRLERGSDVYVGSLRVRRYVKPVYEVTLSTDKKSFATKEAVTGKVKLQYPNGKPIANALVRIVANAQKYAMMSGQLAADSGKKKLALDKEFRTSADGTLSFSLPAQDEPSRYIIEAMATDAAYAKVTAHREVLVQNGEHPTMIVSSSRFSLADKEAVFTLKSSDDATLDTKTLRWQAIRAEDQSVTDGKLNADGTFSVRFVKGGAYSVRVLDAKGLAIATEAHWVSGSGIKIAEQTIQMVADKEEYIRGDTARVMIAFASPVQEALLTLERDAVHAQALLSKKSEWIRLEKVDASQYRAEIPIIEGLAPNVSFSVLTVQQGQYYFSNKGLKVRTDPVEIKVVPSQQVFKPGETVTLDITTTVSGQSLPATLSLSVVDEMVYVLQPEVAPAMGDFFYHPRRNQVRTIASLDFHTYNLSTPGKSDEQARNDGPYFRPLKLRERPRRDDRDTAAFFPKIITDANGHASVSFVMPDSLTRWRITSRAITATGGVGQSSAFVESRKDVYIKWLGESTFREGDAPALRFAAFNETSETIQGDFNLKGPDLEFHMHQDLLPGENAISVPWNKVAPGDFTVSYDTGADNKELDALTRLVNVIPASWTYSRSDFVPVKEGIIAVNPAGVFSSLQVRVVSGMADEVARVAKQLMDYPYGCIEQVTSRLLPLSALLQNLSDLAPDDDRVVRVRRLTEAGRARLLALAGSNYHFGWWGDSLHDDAMMTAYAHLALFETEKALGISVRLKSHAGVLSAYTKTGQDLPVDQRAFVVWVAARLGLSAQNLATGVAEALRDQITMLNFAIDISLPVDARYDLMGSRYHAPITLDGEAWQKLALALLLLDASGQADVKTTTGIDPDLLATAILGRKMELDPMLVAVTLMRQRHKKISTLPSGAEMESLTASLLRRVSFDTPTLQRALTLLFLTGANPVVGNVRPKPTIKAGSEWQTQVLASGAVVYRLNPGQAKAHLNVAGSVAGESLFAVEYESLTPPTERQAVQLTHQLFALTREEATGEYRAKSVGALDWEVNTDGVYLEVVTMKSSEDLRFNVLDVPLPPGADVEKTTWGMKIPISDIDPDHVDTVVDVEDPQQTATGTDVTVQTKKVVKKDYLELKDLPLQERDLGYAMPITQASGEEVRVIRLLRFRDPGKFGVPSARLLQMYSGAVAFEQGFKDDGLRHISVH